MEDLDLPEDLGFAIGEKGYIGIGTTGTNMRDFCVLTNFSNPMILKKT